MNKSIPQHTYGLVDESMTPQKKWAKAFGEHAGNLDPYKARLATMSETELLAIAQALGVLKSGRHLLGDKKEAVEFFSWAQGFISRELLP